MFILSYQSNVAKNCLDTILSIQPKDSSGGAGETRESVVNRLADDMLEKLPEDYIPHEVSVYLISTVAPPLPVPVLQILEINTLFFIQVKARLEKMGPYAPMNIFLRQELDRMQRVITAVRETLTDLKLAIDGTIIMSEVK